MRLTNRGAAVITAACLATTGIGLGLLLGQPAPTPDSLELPAVMAPSHTADSPTLQTPQPVATLQIVTEWAAPEPEAPYTVHGLPPCPMEDSVGCFWDASTMGNGVGRSFDTAADGTVTYWDGKP